MMRYFFIIGSLLIFSLPLLAQAEKMEELKINGQIVTALITEDNDTLIIADLDDVTVSSLRKFKTKKKKDVIINIGAMQ